MKLWTRTFMLTIAIANATPAFGADGVATTADNVARNQAIAAQAARTRAELQSPAFQTKLAELEKLANAINASDDTQRPTKISRIESALDSMTTAQKITLTQALINRLDTIEKNSATSIKDDYLGHFMLVSTIAIYLVAKFYDKSKASEIIGGFLGILTIGAYGFGAIDRWNFRSGLTDMRSKLVELRNAAVQRQAAEAL